MRRACVVALALTAVLSQAIAAEDAKTVVGNASKAMGVRATDFSQPASRPTWTTDAVPVTGVATLAPGQQNITPQDMAWAQQLEIWIAPWGFLKAAPSNNGLVIGYLPKEKILVYADMFNLPSPSSPVPNPPWSAT